MVSDMKKEEVAFARSKFEREVVEREEKQAKLTLSKPRSDMLSFAREVCKEEVDCNVLDQMQLQGFGFHMSPVYLVVHKGVDVKPQVAAALGKLPACVQMRIGELMASCTEAYGNDTVFDFQESQGHYTNVTFKRTETAEHIAMSIL